MERKVKCFANDIWIGVSSLPSFAELCLAFALFAPSHCIHLRSTHARRIGPIPRRGYSRATPCCRGAMCRGVNYLTKEQNIAKQSNTKKPTSGEGTPCAMRVRPFHWCSFELGFALCHLFFRIGVVRFVPPICAPYLCPPICDIFSFLHILQNRTAGTRYASLGALLA